MTTNAKTGRQKHVKKAGCKMAHPICNDKAEAFVGPQAEVRPRFSEEPKEQEVQAFRLHAQGWTERRIAAELGCSQPTVHRAIDKYRRWFGSTLPEDRGEMTGFGRFRVALEEHRIFLQHQRELAMQEWERSRESVPTQRVRTKVYPEGRKIGGLEIKEVHTDEFLQRRSASASHLNAAARRSLELTMLEAGYLGVRRLSCDEAMDPDERDRWDRAMTSRDTTITEVTKKNDELTRKVAELEAKLAAARPGSGVFGMSDSPLPSTPQPKTPDPGQSGEGSHLDESRIAPKSPIVNQTSPAPQVASPIQQAPCGDLSATRQPVSQRVNQVNQEHPSGGPGTSRRQQQSPRFSQMRPVPPPLGEEN